MAVTKEFLKLFDSLMSQYQIQGKGGYLNWGMDKNYETINNALLGLRDIIENNQDVFNDHSLLQYLTNSSLMHLVTDPIFASNVNQLLVLYNQHQPSAFSSILSGRVHINVEPAKQSPVDLIQELHRAIENVQHAHDTDRKVMQFQLEQLQEDNDLLKKRVKELSQAASINLAMQAQVEQLEKAKGLLRELNQLLELETASSHGRTIVSMPGYLNEERTLPAIPINAMYEEVKTIPPLPESSPLPPSPRSTKSGSEKKSILDKPVKESSTPLSSNSFLQELQKQRNKLKKVGRNHDIRENEPQKDEGEKLDDGKKKFH